MEHSVFLDKEFRSENIQSNKSMLQRYRTLRQPHLTDDDEISEEIKIIIKFLRIKYHNTQFLSEAGATPVDLESLLNELAKPKTSRTETSIKKSLTKPVTGSPLFRLCKNLMFIIIFQCFLLVIGGVMFVYFEADDQKMSYESALRDFDKNITKKSIETLQISKSPLCLDLITSKECLESIKEKLSTHTYQTDYQALNKGWDWNFGNAVYYSATILTTIGYGNMTCRTTFGMIFTIVFAIVGIPHTVNLIRYHGAVNIYIFRKVLSFLERKFGRNLTNDAEFDALLGIDDGRDEITKIYAGFPLRYAFIMIISYVFLGSYIISYWENWSYLTAFYFFIISITTIGFGDIVPERSRTSVGIFVLYYIGVVLCSMVYNIVQERTEASYMRAFELIDLFQDILVIKPDQSEEKTENPVEVAVEAEAENRADSPKIERNLQPSCHLPVQWRNRNQQGNVNDRVPDRPESGRRYSVITPGEQLRSPPPVLNALINISMRQKLHSENLKSKRLASHFLSNEKISRNDCSREGSSSWYISNQVKNQKKAASVGKLYSRASTPNYLSTTRNQSSSDIESSSDKSMNTEKNCQKKKSRLEVADIPFMTESRESLDQPMEELELPVSHHSLTPKPQRETIKLPTSYYPSTQQSQNEPTSSVITPLIEEEID